VVQVPGLFQFRVCGKRPYRFETPVGAGPCNQGDFKIVEELPFLSRGKCQDRVNMRLQQPGVFFLNRGESLAQAHVSLYLGVAFCGT
jgi:hypothetical protein